MRKLLIILVILGAIAVASSVFATESPEAATQTPNDDPWESVNRPIFGLNLVLDRHVIRPVAIAYHNLPGAIRYGIGNELTNLSEPLNALHGILQLNPKIFFTSFWRFTLNSTLGLGGVRDFAGENGLHNTSQDMGKTLGRWGVVSGPYIVLPVLGPSSLRNTVGKVADFFDDPTNFVISTPYQVGISLADGIATRDRQMKVIDEFYYYSLDPYVASRSAYLQNEAFESARHETIEPLTDAKRYPALQTSGKEADRQRTLIEAKLK